ncbi:hypothetical protein JEQ12_008854 [Ovis aries]|uniref:Uncharacterized protein n=1 Tax=Ovis aries TaxID=9940 RepID=A0A836D568_SHEEP|nr:hypothetical protein JEQ12_008854 [Ovis aries]
MSEASQEAPGEVFMQKTQQDKHSGLNSSYPNASTDIDLIIKGIVKDPEATSKESQDSSSAINWDLHQLTRSFLKDCNYHYNSIVHSNQLIPTNHLKYFLPFSPQSPNSDDPSSPGYCTRFASLGIRGQGLPVKPGRRKG